ncbi:TPM domain-containing protein [Cyanobium sp. FACHB-13342]|uniref:photosystem II repair protein Psb32 n=1 Tax=Cyanobium sp. FACHB-13342 TaxID=2692793 RepID=UPI001F55A591|nr:TPM domain-containing protein [Cyanobium sp. FACHB-13342]
MPTSPRATRWTPLLALLAALCCSLGSLVCPAPALAISAAGLPAAAPQERVLDTADVLSRAARAELGKTLETFSADRVDAHLVTVNRLDYGLSLPALGADLLQRWADAGAEPNQLLFLIDSQTNSAAVVAAPALSAQLDANLLRSTARTTMAQPIRDGGRYRQGSLDAMTRLLTVLEGGEDPGEPVTAEVVTQPTNIPTKEETASSNAFTWVVVLLVLGTIVPMLTWWVFSR